MSTTAPSIWDQAEREQKKPQTGSVWDQAAGAPVSEEDLPGSTPLLRRKAAGLGPSLVAPTPFERQRNPQYLTNTQQESDIASRNAKEPGIVLSDADVAMLGTGGYSLGRNIIRQGFRAALTPVVKSAVGATAGKYVGRELGGLVGHPEAGGTIGGLAGGLYGLRGERPAPFDTPTNGETVGAPLPSADEFYARRGAEMNAVRRQSEMLSRRAPTPFETPTTESVGAPLPSADEFYENRGRDLMARERAEAALQRSVPKTGPFAGATSSAEPVGMNIPLPVPRGTPTPFPIVQSAVKTPPTEPVSLFPEPREPMPSDRPGAMWSVGREEVLPAAAKRGAPGAADVLRNIGKPIILTPRQGTGYAAPGEFEAAQGRMQEPVGKPLPPAAESLGLRPGFVERRTSVRDVQGPDLMRTARAQELRAQLTDPSLSNRDRAIIQSQLDDLKANPFERHEGGDINSMKAKKTVSREEAEANTEKRKEGRSKRFGGVNQ